MESRRGLRRRFGHLDWGLQAPSATGRINAFPSFLRDDMRPRQQAVSVIAIGLSATILTLGVGCATQQATESAPSSSVAKFETTGGQHLFMHPEEFEHDSAIARALDRMGPEARTFHAHTVTLSNPYFEGRGPGTRGNARAGEYISFYMEQAGLTPAFYGETEAADGSVVMSPESSFLQSFEVPGERELEVAEFAVTHDGDEQALLLESEFNPLAVSGNASAEGAFAFVGYAIDNGKDGYSSFGPHDALDGRIAIVLRFEPMDENGRSLWADAGRWSRRAALLPKIESAFERGAAGVVLVNAPGADDPRMGEILNLKNSRFGPSFEKPVAMMSLEAAERLVAMGDVEGRSLMELRQLADSGIATMVDLPHVRGAMEISIHREDIETWNVGGVLAGKGDLANEYVVVGAHYDHIGYGEFSSRSPSMAGHVHPGADDNASGTAGVLMIADEMAQRYEQLAFGEEARSIIFVCFSGEEMGLLGSKHFVQNPPVTLSTVAAMLNMDMIGRLRDRKLELYGVGTAEQMMDLVQPVIDASGLKVSTSKRGDGPSDHSSFFGEGVPVLAAFTGLHSLYHTVNDVPSTLNFEGGAQVTEFVGELTWALATTEQKPTFVAPKTPTPQMRGVGRSKVRLGISPEYADDEAGVVVGGVSPGTTAEKAGLKKGDRIVLWGGEELAGAGGLMQALVSHKPGDEVDIVIVRDGERQTVRLVMQARGGAQ